MSKIPKLRNGDSLNLNVSLTLARLPQNADPKARIFSLVESGGAKNHLNPTGCQPRHHKLPMD